MSILFKTVEAAEAKAKELLGEATVEKVQTKPFAVKVAEALYNAIAGKTPINDAETKIRKNCVMGKDQNGFAFASTVIEAAYKYIGVAGEEVTSPIPARYEYRTQRSDGSGVWSAMAFFGYRIVWCTLENWEQFGLTKAKSFAGIVISKTGKKYTAYRFPHHKGGVYGSKVRMVWDEQAPVSNTPAPTPPATPTVNPAELMAAMWSKIQGEGLALFDATEDINGNLEEAVHALIAWQENNKALLDAAEDLAATADLAREKIRIGKSIASAAQAAEAVVSAVTWVGEGYKKE